MPEWLFVAAVIFFAVRLSRGARCGRRLETRRRIEAESVGARHGREEANRRAHGVDTPHLEDPNRTAGSGRAGSRPHERRRAPARSHTGGRPARAKRPPARHESPLEALQRKFVDGTITVEEYERELDLLYRKAPRTRA